MTESINQEVEKKEGLSIESPTLPFEKPEQFIYISDEVIKIVSQYMAIVISEATPNRNVDIKTILENAKNMFRDGVRYHDNLWVQHCAASIREILSFIDSGHFNQAYKTIQSTDPNVERTLRFLIRANAYLSSIVHFRESAKVGDADNLYPDQGYGQKNHDEFLKNEQEFFEKVCIDIIYTLHYLFTHYCAGSNKDNNNEPD